MTKSDEIKALAERYNKIERNTDSLGRLIGVRVIKPSQRIKVEEWYAGITGTITITDEHGKPFELARISEMMWAAAVCEVDGRPVPFARNRAELDAVLDMLDAPGLNAAATGVMKLAIAEAEERKDSASVEDAAKNSSSTPASDSLSG